MRLLREREHLDPLDSEHCGGILSRSEHAVANIEMPVTAVFRLVRVGKSLQGVSVGDPRSRALNDDVKAPSPGVAPCRQRDLSTMFEIASLLLPQPSTRTLRICSAYTLSV